jgi:hypothetical protein
LNYLFALFCFETANAWDPFSGIINEKDPSPLWPRANNPTGVKSISFGEVLAMLQSPEFKEDITKFALIGFGRLNGFNKRYLPYKRGHVYSAGLLNITLLKDSKLRFDPRIWLWGDIELNERVNKTGLLICKFQRITQFKKQMPTGGCNRMIIGGGTAEARSKTADVPTPPVSTPALDDVFKFFLGVRKVTHEEAIAYAETCKKEEIDFCHVKGWGTKAEIEVLPLLRLVLDIDISWGRAMNIFIASRAL